MMKEGHLVSSVLAHLGQLHPVVGEVVHHEDEGTHSVHLVAPAGDQDLHEDKFSMLSLKEKIYTTHYLRVSRARVARWWTNISQKSLRFTSVNWVTRRDQ